MAYASDSQAEVPSSIPGRDITRVRLKNVFKDSGGRTLVPAWPARQGPQPPEQTPLEIDWKDSLSQKKKITRNTI